MSKATTALVFAKKGINKKKKNQRSSDSSAVAAFGSHRMSLFVCVCVKESALLFGISLQGHVFNVEKKERGGRREARQTSFITLSFTT